MTHRKRFFLFTAVLVLSSVIIAGSIGYRITASTLKQSASDTLIQVRKAKAHELTRDFQYLNDTLVVTSELPSLTAFLGKYPAEYAEIREWLRTHGNESAWRSLISQTYNETSPGEISRTIAQMSPLSIFLQAQFLQSAHLQNKSPQDITQLSKVPGNLRYFKSHTEIHRLLRPSLERLKLNDILLVDPQGNVAYSTKKGLDFGSNLVSGAFANSRLAQAFRWSTTASSGSVQFFDFAPLTHFWSIPVAYLATPLFARNRYVGTLLFEIPLERVENILSNGKNWAGLGLKNTGEVVAFGTQGIMRNNARLYLEDPEKFTEVFRRHSPQQGSLPLILKNRGTALNLTLLPRDLKKYLSAPSLEETDNDYLGVKTLKSVGRFTLIGNTEWILIAKMNTQEVYGPLFTSIPYVLFGAVLLTTLALGAAFYLYRRFRAQTTALSLGMQRLREFDFSTRLPVEDTKDELNELYEKYNDIAVEYLKLKVSKDFLENAIHSLHEAFFIVEAHVNSEGKTHLQIRGLNPAAAEMVGIASSALKSTDLQMWIEADFAKVLRAPVRMDEKQTAISIEGVLKKVSGERIPLELSWAQIPTPIDHQPILVFVGRDIRWKKEIEKELKLNEEILKESQSISRTGSFRWDLRNGKVHWSEEEFHIFGLDPEKTVPNFELFRSMILPEDLPIFDQALQDAHKNIKPFNIDLRMRKREPNEVIWVRCQARTEYDDYGNPLFMYGTNQDITELRRTEQSLIAAKNEALKSSQAKSEFLARMSHEIRTPMNAIMGMADLLKETKLDKDQEYYVNIFCKAGEVLMALINDILDLSKIEAGEVSIENIPFDLKSLMDDVTDIMKPRSLEKGLEFSIEISPGISPYLMGDPNKLRQVLINLIGNSIKFTNGGFVRVLIGKNPSKKDTLMISVTDSGAGIPTSKQHLIFQKFSQADSSITRRYGGTGLGLAISKSLVELMGGQIWFKSREGIGTTFFFTIPYREQIYNPVTHKPLALQGSELDFAKPKQRDPHKKIRILIADDTEDNRTLFTHYLKNGPYEIIEAQNGLEAIDKIKSDKFDIVFMDVQMPEMDGYAATDAIRKWEHDAHKDHIPIIALTAHALSEDRQKSLKAGCDDHIAKPFKKETLMSVINRYSL
ncbi:ATP-binding protein [Bdellovibrio sp. 22V]|uniref:ATP-binding protein n=1 Tax=Bdellovibrio TaxID=958 RepID=UPI002543F200|nr:ATP-binding protein [Bdellovibrio sp. 22V]WII72120.1 ATP-binding protein [Bdellovibrio sp. 22V]